MRVSQLAQRAGVTPTAVRFYEAEGILPVPSRADNGYRDYGEADVCRLRIVVALRGLGLDLAESGRLAGMCSSGECEGMAGELTARLAERRREVSVARAELDHLDKELAALDGALVSGQPMELLCPGKEDCA
jgi:MerR family transcriptional regulator, copper efflux regulator